MLQQKAISVEGILAVMRMPVGLTYVGHEVAPREFGAVVDAVDFHFEAKSGQRGKIRIDGMEFLQIDGDCVRLKALVAARVRELARALR